jgi:non-heme chloroperoxidase
MDIESAFFVGTDGLRLMADALGDSAHPAVVLLPGAGQTRFAWRRTALALAVAGYRVISLDLRGHGDSDWSKNGDYSIDAFVGDVLQVLHQVTPEPVVVGASIGGIAMAIAVGENPGIHVKGVVLVDVVPDMRIEGLTRIRAFMEAGAAGFPTLEEAAAAVAHFLPGRPKPSSTAGLENNLRRGADDRLYWHWDPAFHAGSKARAADGMFERMAAALHRVHVPTLLVSGGQSDVVNPDGIDRLRRSIPDARWVSIAGADHMMTGVGNHAFTAALLDFVAAVNDEQRAGVP